MKAKVGVILLAVLAVMALGATEEQPVTEVENLKADVTALGTIVKSQATRIERLKKALDKAQKELAEQKWQNRQLTKACKQAGIDVRALLQRGRKRRGQEPKMSELRGELAIGQVGFLVNAAVIQVHDAGNALVEFEIRPSVIDYTPKKVGKSVYYNLPIEAIPAERTTVWIEGLDTKGLVDGQQLGTVGPFQVVSTKSYQTVGGGQKTIFLLNPISTDQSDELLQEQAPPVQRRRR
ncbi:MAG: hypothetical protein ACYST6_16795 [Planctomycetota bacterium]|jgi:hypothetical protein